MYVCDADRPGFTPHVSRDAMSMWHSAYVPTHQVHVNVNSRALMLTLT